MELDIPTYPRRVKVYFLEDDVWVDKGTGYCSGEIFDIHTKEEPPADPDNDHYDGGSSDGSSSEISQRAHLIVRNEKDSEDVILDSTVRPGVQYQKQQETLIVWVDPVHRTDVALSFQEAEGCANLCDFLVHVQQTVDTSISILCSIKNDDDTEITEVIAGPLVPPPTLALGSLEAVLECVSPLGPNKFNREPLARFILSNNYLDKLPAIFEMAEGIESLDDLHYLSQIVKVLFLMGDAGIWDYFLRDEIYRSAIGVLEYDRDMHPSQKANYREYFDKFDRFREVVPLPTAALRTKIRHSFRLEFARDVVLSRVIDENVQGIMNSVLFFHQSEIISTLQTSQTYLTNLFNMYRDSQSATSPAEIQDLSSRREDGVRLVREIWSMVKTFPIQQRAGLYSALVKNGLFELFKYGLGIKTGASFGTRRATTDLVSSLLDFDAKIVRQSNSENPAVLDVLSELILSDEPDHGLKVLASEALRLLLEPPVESIPSLAGPNGVQRMLVDARSLPGQITSPDMQAFVNTFYGTQGARLFAPLDTIGKHEETTEEETRKKLIKMNSYGTVEILCDLFAFCIHSHGLKCYDFFETHNIASALRVLIAHGQKSVRLAAIRCLKEAVVLNEAAFLEKVVQYGVIDALLDLLWALSRRNNLLTSACLEVMFLVVAKHNFLGRANRASRIIVEYAIEHVAKEKLAPLREFPEWIKCVNFHAQRREELASSDNDLLDDDNDDDRSELDAGDGRNYDHDNTQNHDRHPPSLVDGSNENDPQGEETPPAKRRVLLARPPAKRQLDSGGNDASVTSDGQSQSPVSSSKRHASKSLISHSQSTEPDAAAGTVAGRSGSARSAIVTDSPPSEIDHESTEQDEIPTSGRAGMEPKSAAAAKHGHGPKRKDSTLSLRHTFSNASKKLSLKFGRKNGDSK